MSEYQYVAFRAIDAPVSKTTGTIDLRHAAIQIGNPLPLLPLPLDRGLTLPLDLEPSYVEACKRSRLI